MTNLNFDKVFPNSFPIIFFHAHPDDESFLSAGLLNELVTRGRKCIVVFAAAAIVDEDGRTFIRQREANDACRILGVDLILYLDFCETKFSQETALPLVCQSITDMSDNLFSILLKNNVNSPFVFVSYDKNGGYGNKDHKIIHMASKDFREKHIDSVAHLLEVTINRDKVIRWLSDASKRLSTEFLPKLSYWVENFGLSEKEIDYQYQLTEHQLVLKREALSKHKSQMFVGEFPLSLSDSDFREVFGYEYLKMTK